MRRVALRAGAAFALGLGLVVLPAAAEDKPAEDKPAPSPSSSSASKAPTFPGYVYVTDVVGEVVRASDSSITLRITWFEPTQKKNNGRPNLSANHRHYRNPFATNMNRPHPTVQFKEVHHDYPLDYLPESLVRLKSLPPKLDENGKKVAHTQKEIDELRTPSGVTGYAANRSDVTSGTYVEVFLIRDKKIPAEKVSESDLRIKYAVILGHDPNPPKDIGSSSNPPKKKN
jgi:hypothetical protein